MGGHVDRRYHVLAKQVAFDEQRFWVS